MPASPISPAPDGHRGVFPAAWLGGPPSAAAGRTEDDKQLWTAAELPALPTARWADYRESDTERLRLLLAVQRRGVGLLTGSPTRPGTVLDVAATFGYVRETNYGRLFDVRMEADPTNLASTSRAIPPHTDNPYRDPVPSMQLLHFLTNAIDGGRSGVVDGFRAAAAPREEDPEAFGELISTPVPFAWTDGYHHLAAEGPVVETDAVGRVRAVRWNDRSMQPLRVEPDSVAAAYAALRRFAATVSRSELLVEVRLEPGDCLILDNTRVLHGRTAFADTGRRHLQGCYSDLDGLDSAVARLHAVAAGGGP